MSLKFALPLVFATAYLPFAGSAFADNYTEYGDAGDQLASAYVTTAPLGPLTALTSITGATTPTNQIGDGDMYEITVTAGNLTAPFTASTTAFVSGANNFDDQLFLFNSSGVGIAANDDAATGGSQASITLAAGTLLPGNYYLAIEGSGRYPIDATGKLIFPNYEDGTTDPSGTYGPNTGAGALATMGTGYTGNTNEVGKYVIAISGAQFTAIGTVVPEPSSLAALAAGLGGLVLTFRRRSAK